MSCLASTDEPFVFKRVKYARVQLLSCWIKKIMRGEAVNIFRAHNNGIASPSLLGKEVPVGQCMTVANHKDRQRILYYLDHQTALAPVWRCCPISLKNASSSHTLVGEGGLTSMDASCAGSASWTLASASPAYKSK